jgi:hypothetical protein
MRSVDIKTAAFAVGVSAKWIDNLLSAHELPGIHRGRRGVQRRVTEDGLLAIEIVRLLTVELGMAVRIATNIALDATSRQEGGWARAVVPSGIALLFPMADIQERLRRRLRDAVEAAVPIRRGRPLRSAIRRKNRTPDA